MSRLASPLRYPGGKACLLDIATQIISYNALEQRHYVEPYSGGCGLALSLLFDGHVSHIHLNDLDRSVWAFWHSVLNDCDGIVDMINTCELSVAEWDRQRAIQHDKAIADVMDLGFSTFYLSRTNRSGIIHGGGIIGGRDQTGEWTIGCRFNRDDLIQRVKRVHLYRGRIHLYNEDAESFLGRYNESFPTDSLTYIDPPYYEKGSLLYRNSYLRKDHRRLSHLFSELGAPWFLTYDNVEPIRELYDRFISFELDIGYSVHTKRRGSELLVLSDNLAPPPCLDAGARAA